MASLSERSAGRSPRARRSGQGAPKPSARFSRQGRPRRPSTFCRRWIGGSPMSVKLRLRSARGRARSSTSRRSQPSERSSGEERSAAPSNRAPAAPSRARKGAVSPRPTPPRSRPAPPGPAAADRRDSASAPPDLLDQELRGEKLVVRARRIERPRAKSLGERGRIIGRGIHGHSPRQAHARLSRLYRATRKTGKPRKGKSPRQNQPNSPNVAPAGDDLRRGAGVLEGGGLPGDEAPGYQQASLLDAPRFIFART